MNLANKLTLTRLAVIPFLLIAVNINYSCASVFAGLLFLLAATTDGLDGYIARKQGEVTELGKLIDPLADKILVLAGLIILVEIGHLPGWVAVIIAGREIAVTGLRAVLATKNILLPASRLGKYKMAAQTLSIVSLFIWGFKPGIPLYLVYYQIAALSTAVLLTVSSGLDYLVKSWKLIR